MNEDRAKPYDADPMLAQVRAETGTRPGSLRSRLGLSEGSTGQAVDSAIAGLSPAAAQRTQRGSDGDVEVATFGGSGRISHATASSRLINRRVMPPP